MKTVVVIVVGNASLHARDAPALRCRDFIKGRHDILQVGAELLWKGEVFAQATAWHELHKNPLGSDRVVRCRAIKVDLWNGYRDMEVI
jgi:hypothetical protein